MSRIRHIEFIAVEIAPLDYEECFILEYTNIPKAFKDALITICNNLDNSDCGACTNSVGYVLVEDDDYPECSGLRWKPLWLTRVDNSPIGVLCEDCAPIEPQSITTKMAMPAP
jgi:hypothetical protein